MNNELYFSYEKLLRKKARQVSNTFHIEFDEIYSEACLILVKSFYTFDPDKACFSTHLYHNLKDLYNFAKNNYPNDPLPENYDIPYIQRFLSFSDEYNFSGLEKDICDYAEKNSFNANKKTNKTITKQDIIRHFKDQEIPTSQINYALHNIEELIK